MIDIFPIPVTQFPIEDMGFDKLNAPDVCRHLFKKAAHILQQHGELDPIAFLFTETSCFLIGITGFMKNADTKNMLSFLLRKTAGETSIIGVAIVMEAWARDANEIERRTGIQEDKRPVEDHPDRKEIIVVQCEWYNNDKYMLTAKFEREKDEKGIETIKIEASNSGTDFEGVFVDLFPPTRSGGYFN